MKKILLIIAIAFLIFQMVVLATAIDVGSTAINRSTAMGSYTIISKTGAADGTGTITSVQIYACTALSGCKVGTFFVVSGNNLTARDSETVQVSGQDPGVVPIGLQTATVNLDIVTGDYLGIYFVGGTMEAGSPYTSGIWYLSGDHMSSVNQEFSFSATWDISIHGTGETAAEEEDNVIFFGTNF